MRLTASIFVGLLAFAPLTSEAMPTLNALNTDATPNIIEAAVKCGPRAHYVRGYRDRNHHYVKGRCVRDRRR